MDRTAKMINQKTSAGMNSPEEEVAIFTPLTKWAWATYRDTGG